jgi:hypothetical protein
LITLLSQVAVEAQEAVVVQVDFVLQLPQLAAADH